MSLSIVFAVAVFLTAYILSQKLSLNARANLDDPTKLKISDIFAQRNVNYSIIVFAMVIVYFLTLYMFPGYNGSLSIGYGVGFLIYIFGKLFLNIRKLKEISAPPAYVRSVIVGFIVFIVGAVLAVFIVVVGNSNRAY